MKESKIIEEFQVETRREDILQILDARFGRRAAAEFAPLLQEITDDKLLIRLHRLPAKIATLNQFRDQFRKT